MKSFSDAKIKRWRVVDATTTARMAGHACKGVNFSGCSKTHVYGRMLKKEYAGSAVDTLLFEHLMDAASIVIRRHNEELEAALKIVIRTCTQP